MPKKILLAEKSDAIRSIAESILHQSGYDAISASSVDKAKELIITVQPNMVVIGADLVDSEGKYLYDSIEENPMTSSMPILLIADPNGRSLPYPDEVILPRPFDPKDFLEKIKLFVGGGMEKKPAEKIETLDPFASGSIDDEFLDAALGIDNIDVEKSEDMDRTFVTGKLKVPPPAEKRDGLDILQPVDDDSEKKVENQKVESLMIRDEAKASSQPQTDPSASTKIEISSDQYGLIKSDEPIEAENKHVEHDYNWFINEMQKEDNAPAEVSNKADSLKIKPTSDVVEPIGPATISKINMQSEPAETVIKPGGVDQFIEDFKKEMGDIPEPPAGKTETSPSIQETSPSLPEIGELDQKDLHHFSNYLAELLAEKLAKELVAKIDAEEIYRMAKDDIIRFLAAKNTPHN